jgi:hypothetical protein
MTGLMNVTLRASTTRKASTRAGGGGQSQWFRDGVFPTL